MWRFGSKEDPIFLATTDYPFPQRFDINTLETLELLAPDNPPGTKSGCTHWMREPGTDNSINFQIKQGSFLQEDYVEVQRYKPNNRDFAKPEIVATFIPKVTVSIHSFSMTENYAIFIFYPMSFFGTTCLMTHGFHANDCTEVRCISTLFSHLKHFLFIVV